MDLVNTQAPIYDQLLLEFLSREIWKRQLMHLKTSKLRKIARELGILSWARLDRWSLIDAILSQPYEKLELNLVQISR